MEEMEAVAGNGIVAVAVTADAMAKLMVVMPPGRVATEAAAIKPVIEAWKGKLAIRMR